jgi:hypothetical protein
MMQSESAGWEENAMQRTRIMANIGGALWLR